MNLNQSMYQYLLEGIGESDSNKLLYFRRKIKAKELVAHINKVANFLLDCGVKAGDSVAIALPNIPQAVISLYAVNAIGSIANLMHPMTKTPALIASLKETHSKYIFIMDKFANEHMKTFANEGIIPIICRASDYLTPISKFFYHMIEPKTENNIAIAYKKVLETEERLIKIEENAGLTDAIYLHSGGTTGAPKTVVLSNYAFNSLTESVVDTMCKNKPFNDEDKMLMVLPVFHGFGLGVCVHTALTRSASVLVPKFDPKSVIKLIKTHKITYLAGVPAMFSRMLAEPTFDDKYLGNVKQIFCGGDTLNVDLKNKFDSILTKNNSSAEILEGYGLTEVTTVCTVNPNGAAKAYSQGPALNGAKLAIMDDAFNILPPMTDGIIYVNSPSLMTRYLNDEQTTNDVIHIDAQGEKWLMTGDIGCIDTDGYLYFRDRVKRTIKIAGTNVFPSRIEEVVSSMPEIDYACVARKSNQGKAYTVLYIVINKKFKFSSLIENNILLKIELEISKYALPKEVIPVDKLKLTQIGKVDYSYYER